MPFLLSRRCMSLELILRIALFIMILPRMTTTKTPFLVFIEDNNDSKCWFFFFLLTTRIPQKANPGLCCMLWGCAFEDEKADNFLYFLWPLLRMRNTLVKVMILLNVEDGDHSKCRFCSLLRMRTALNDNPALWIICDSLKRLILLFIENENYLNCWSPFFLITKK